MKKAIIAVSIFLLLFSFAPSAFAAGNSEVTIVIDSRKVESDVPPFMDKGRVLLPVRAIFEALDGKVYWDPVERRVTGFKGAKSVDLYIGQNEAIIAGNKTVVLDVSAQLVGGRTFVPVRFIAESLGSTVEWDGVNRVVRITTSKTPVVQDIADLINPEVVLITTDSSQGSGFIWNKDGDIVTAHHVVDQAEWVKVKTADKKEYDATVVTADSVYDLAIVRLVGASGDFPYVQWSNDMQNVSVGEQVVAIGSPQGFENSTSTGVVSAKRDIDGLQYFQIDAAISPGSSGGPLMDYFGRVIGVNVATYIGAQNLNFAVPIDYIEYMVHRPDEKRRMAYIDFVEAEKTWMESYNELVDVEQQAYTFAKAGNYNAAIKLFEDTILPGWDQLYDEVGEFNVKSEEVLEAAFAFLDVISDMYYRTEAYYDYLLSSDHGDYELYELYFDDSLETISDYESLRTTMEEKYPNS